MISKFRGRVKGIEYRLQFVQFKKLLRLWRVHTKIVKQTCVCKGETMEAGGREEATKGGLRGRPRAEPV